jgi:energy-coupling factor transporter ATP-binding protein EcfA2
MRVKRFAVRGLFDTFDHEVPIDGQRRLRIIYGPNGYGKTTILRLIDAIFNRNTTFLRRTPFNSLSIYTDEGSVLRLQRSNGEEVPSLEYTYSPKRGKERSFEDKPADISFLRHLPLSMIEHEIPNLDRVGTRLWRDGRTGRVLDLGDVLQAYGDELPIPSSFREMPSPPEWFTQLIASIPVRLIEAQRLLRFSEEAPASRRQPRTQWSATVEAYADDLAEAIKSKLAESGTLSQSLDRTFPQRLVESTDKHLLSEDELLTRMAAVDTSRNHLIGAGLIDPEPQPPFQVRRGELTEQETSVLSLWVADVERKLAIFRELAQKIDLFKDIINQHFLFKEMIIDRERGFSFKTPVGAAIPPASLSSGEQHELILAYELLFKLQPDSLVLIDEPELSLHVAWQLRFLTDLEAIISLVPFDALIATHSPQIINDRWDLTAKLEGPTAHA